MVDHVLDDVLAVHPSMDCCMMRSEVDAWTRRDLLGCLTPLMVPVGGKPCHTHTHAPHANPTIRSSFVLGNLAVPPQSTHVPLGGGLGTLYTVPLYVRKEKLSCSLSVPLPEICRVRGQAGAPNETQKAACDSADADARRESTRPFAHRFPTLASQFVILRRPREAQASPQS